MPLLPPASSLEPAVTAQAGRERLHGQMQVRFGAVPHDIANPLFAEPGFVLSKDAFRFETPGGALFHYALGEGITARRPEPSLEDEFRLYLWGTVFGAVSWLNGFFPLHASAVAMDGRAVAFTAESGGGKSTLAAGLACEGFAHLADDTLPLIETRGEVFAVPDRKPLKLWEDAFDRVQAIRGAPIASMPGKFYAEPLEKCADPLPLSDLVLLEFGDEDALTPIAGAAKLAAIADAMYRDFVPVALGQDEQHAAWIMAIARRVNVWRFIRRRGGTASRAEQILSAIRSGYRR